MRTTRRLFLALVAASGLAACDFTPTLDIETPEYVEGVTVRGFLVADSATVIRLGVSWNPYEGRPTDNQAQQLETPPATVTLLRGGQPVEVLTLRSQRCDRYDFQTETFTAYECGPYAGTVPIEAGATYTLRVEPEGLPTAEATVTVPRRPTLDVTEEPSGADSPRRFRVRLGDPAGGGDLYGLSLLRSFTYTNTISCDPTGVCQDTTITERFPTSFDTSDPVLLAAAAEIDGDISFVTFPDETFDGEVKSFTMSVDARYGGEDQDRGLTVQVAALSADVYDTYRITYFGGGEDNPFAEPVNLPSNVVGGYGLVGGAAVAEAAFGAR